jgi:hypothetical protein
VVEDFDFGTFRKEIPPFLFSSMNVTGGDDVSPNYLMLKTKGNQLETVRFIEDQWKYFSKNIPIEGVFLDSCSMTCWKRKDDLETFSDIFHS